MKLYPYQRAMVDSLLSLPPQTIQFSQPLHPRSWTALYYQKEKLMREGPYKSSTHGDIPLSIRGRGLLQELRTAVDSTVVVARREPKAPFQLGSDTKTGYSVTHARGEIAKYMSELETYAYRFYSRAPSDVRYSMGEPPQVVKRPKTATEISNEMQDELYKNHRAQLLNAFRLAPPIYFDHLKIDPKFTTINRIITENPMKYPSDIGLAAGQQASNAGQAATVTPVEKTRSELIGEATRELCAAQRNLEAIQNVPDGPPAELTVCTYTHGNLSGAISDLVKEQWPTLAKKAVARAKSRVAKAEKAVVTLLS